MVNPLPQHIADEMKKRYLSLLNPSLVKAIPHNAARADSEKNRVLMMALFRRNTLCIARKSDEIRAWFFRKMPQAYCAVLPKN